MIWNASADEIEEFGVYVPAGMPQPGRGVQIDSHGRRYSARLERNRVKLSRLLYQFEFVVLS